MYNFMFYRHDTGRVAPVRTHTASARSASRQASTPPAPSASTPPFSTTTRSSRPMQTRTNLPHGSTAAQDVQIPERIQRLAQNLGIQTLTTEERSRIAHERATQIMIAMNRERAVPTGPPAYNDVVDLESGNCNLPTYEEALESKLSET